jgi:hypothetical protein
MSDAQRETCPNCGEPVAPSSRVCPSCRENLLVDVVLAEPVTEPRARYGLAREISAFGPPALPFSTLRQSLGDPRPVLARDASRLAAQRLSERLAGLGLLADLQPAAGEPPPPSRFRGLAMAGLGAGALLALVLGVLFSDGARRPPSHRPRARAAVQPRPTWNRNLSQPELAALALPAVVSFRAEDGRKALGFLVAPELALTRSAAIGDGKTLKVLTPGGEEVDGEVVKRDDGVGLALVRVPASPAEPLPLGDASALGGGQQIFFAIPTEGRTALQDGLLGGAAQRFQGIFHLAFESGPPSASDGSPVLDAQGRVAGLVAAQPDGVYLLPINYAYTESQLVDPPQPAPDPRKWQDLLAELEAVERVRVGSPR